jgi:hypothetical protein
MKMTLSKKTVKGNSYYYLNVKKKGKLHTSYLGKLDSPKFKKYLLSLTKETGQSFYKKTKARNFGLGLPVVYVEDGLLTYEYSNGFLERHTKKGVLVSNGEEPSE